MREEISFDPMTGEKIVKKVEEKAAEQREEISFDPMTGEKIIKKVEEKAAEQREEVSFDPMTGEKIAKNSAGNVRFDPMTGKAVLENEVLPKHHKKFWKSKTAGILAGVVAVVLVIVMLIQSGVFLKKSDKVLMATLKTFKSVEFAEVQKAIGILGKNRYSIRCEGEIGKEEFAVSYVNTKKQKGMEMNMDITGLGNITGKMVLTQDALQFAMPSITDQAIYYNYQKEKDGVIAEQENGEVVELLDEVLKNIYAGNNNEAYNNLKKSYIKQSRQEKFTKTSKKSFEINGKQRKCQGYELVLNEDNLEKYIDILEEYYNEQYAALDMDDEIEEMLDELRDDIEEIEDLNLTCYLYKGRLAAVLLESEGDEAEWVIHNTKNPLEHMTLEIEDFEVEWEEEKNGSQLEYVLSASGVGDILEMTYDKKSGDYEIEMDDVCSVKGKIDSKVGKVIYTIDKIEIENDDIDLNTSITIAKSVDKISVEGKRFDIGNASESEIEDFFEDINKEMESIFEEVEDKLDEIL